MTFDDRTRSAGGLTVAELVRIITVLAPRGDEPVLEAVVGRLQSVAHSQAPEHRTQLRISVLRDVVEAVEAARSFDGDPQGRRQTGPGDLGVPDVEAVAAGPPARVPPGASDITIDAR